MTNSLIEVTEMLKKEYDERLSKVVGFGTKISDIKCSFCGKPSTEVKRVIAGDRVFICNECVDICKEIVDEENK